MPEADEHLRPSIQQERRTWRERIEWTEPPPFDRDDITKEELYELAREARIEGRSKMTKDQLRTALRRAHDVRRPREG
ncbi:MAG TPA: Rho termination factor N-terminal domain-containing protein [Nitriliruptorales bacterium]|nr:Rho termination factor N-terminal domain-containing protein [Nitriliruptorales bacterium]